MTTAYVNQANKLAWIVETNNDDTPEGFTSYEVPKGTTVNTHYFNGTAVVAYTEAELKLKNTPPSYNASWDDGLMNWVDLRTLEASRTEAKQRINFEWDIATNTGFNYQGLLFSTDASSRSDIDGINGYVALKGVLPTNWVGMWKSKNNEFLPIETVDEWKDFYSAMVDAGTQNFVRAQLLKELINNAATVAEVEAIDWSTPLT